MKICVISTMDGSPWGGSEELWTAMVREALKAGIKTGASVVRWPSIPLRVLDLQERGARIFWRPHSEANGTKRLFRRLLAGSVRHLPYDSQRETAAWFLSSFREAFHFTPDVICISQGWPYDAICFPDLTSLLYASSAPYIIVCQFAEDTCSLDGNARNAAREFYSRAVQVVFVSADNLKSIERQLATKIPNAVILQNPVNLDDLSPVPWPESQTARIASVARLETRYKGQDILLEALSTVEWKQRDWGLVFYGEGVDRRYLQELTDHYRLSERVRFAGHCDSVREIWANNHILAFPSRAEGTPLALVEAMVCGRPAVVTDVGGNANWIEEGKTGFVAEASTTRSFAAAIERAWGSRAHWRAMGDQAHYKIQKTLDPTPGNSLLHVVLGAASTVDSTKARKGKERNNSC